MGDASKTRLRKKEPCMPNYEVVPWPPLFGKMIGSADAVALKKSCYRFLIATRAFYAVPALGAARDGSYEICSFSSYARAVLAFREPPV